MWRGGRLPERQQTRHQPLPRLPISLATMERAPVRPLLLRAMHARIAATRIAVGRVAIALQRCCRARAHLSVRRRGRSACPGAARGRGGGSAAEGGRGDS
eukprot:353849-Chlamydomonas_euryale.AAC.5